MVDCPWTASDAPVRPSFDFLQPLSPHRSSLMPLPPSPCGHPSSPPMARARSSLSDTVNLCCSTMRSVTRTSPCPSRPWHMRLCAARRGGPRQAQLVRPGPAGPRQRGPAATASFARPRAAIPRWFRVRRAATPRRMPSISGSLFATRAAATSESFASPRYVDGRAGREACKGTAWGKGVGGCPPCLRQRP